MDEEYRSIPTKAESRFTEFTPSLTVACTAISQPKKGMITVDGGYKAFASDSVNPVCDEIEGVDFHFAGDEHGVLVLGDSDTCISKVCYCGSNTKCTRRSDSCKKGLCRCGEKDKCPENQICALGECHGI